MPKIKMPRSSPALDMTPMVDLAFLLVTFFMLTASFRLADPVKISTPSAHSEDLLADNVLIVKVDKENRAYIDITGFAARKTALIEMGKKYNVDASAISNIADDFGGMGTFGAPIAKFPEYVGMSAEERESYKTDGIPYDSADNQLAFWITELRRSAQVEKLKADKELKARGVKSDLKKLKFAIKCDSETSYKKLREVMKAMTDQNIFTFELITETEKN